MHSPPHTPQRGSPRRTASPISTSPSSQDAVTHRSPLSLSPSSLQHLSPRRATASNALQSSRRTSTLIFLAAVLLLAVTYSESGSVLAILSCETKISTLSNNIIDVPSGGGLRTTTNVSLVADERTDLNRSELDFAIIGFPKTGEHVRTSCDFIFLTHFITRRCTSYSICRNHLPSLRSRKSPGSEHAITGVLRDTPS